MNTLKEWIGMTWPILIAVGGAAWLVASGFGDVRTEIESVRTDLKSDIAAIDSRTSSIEGRLDLVIDALHIQAEPAQ